MQPVASGVQNWKPPLHGREARHFSDFSTLLLQGDVMRLTAERGNVCDATQQGFASFPYVFGCVMAVTEHISRNV